MLNIFSTLKMFKINNDTKNKKIRKKIVRESNQIASQELKESAQDELFKKELSAMYPRNSVMQVLKEPQENIDNIFAKNYLPSIKHLFDEDLDFLLLMKQSNHVSLISTKITNYKPMMLNKFTKLNFK